MTGYTVQASDPSIFLCEAGGVNIDIVLPEYDTDFEGRIIYIINQAGTTGGYVYVHPGYSGRILIATPVVTIPFSYDSVNQAARCLVTCICVEGQWAVG
jgi:hypothetical protein